MTHKISTHNDKYICTNAASTNDKVHNTYNRAYERGYIIFGLLVLRI